MASSRKSKPNSDRLLEAAVRAALKPACSRGDRLVSGLSGGIDSVVLLDCCAGCAATLGFEARRVHVNHRSVPTRAAGRAFCAHMCKRLGIALTCASSERAAREEPGGRGARARYAVFARQDADFIVLAQHLDDQAETLLLQLLRGAGVKGVSAMPVVRMRRGLGRGKSKPATSNARLSLDPQPAILRPLLESRARDRSLCSARAS